MFDKETIANSLNNFYSAVASKLVEKLQGNTLRWYTLRFCLKWVVNYFTTSYSMYELVVVPDDFKSARITFMFLKKHDKTTVANCRLISIFGYIVLYLNFMKMLCMIRLILLQSWQFYVISFNPDSEVVFHQTHVLDI